MEKTGGLEIEMKLYIVRHAQSESNVGNHTGKETVLSKTGIEQAKRLGLYFKRKNIDKIYCSKMIRAIDTLKEIKPYIPKVPVTYIKKINEHYKGIYNNKPEEYKKVKKASSLPSYLFRPPKGENLYDLERRAQKFLDFLKKNHKTGNILVVGHGFFLRFLIARIFKLHMKELSYFELHNAGVSSFEFDKNFNVKKFEIDDYKHLIKYSSYKRDKKEIK